MLDVTLNPGKTHDDLQKKIDRWEREAVGADEFDPDVWQPFWIKDLSTLETELRRNARDKYSYRELKDFADRIRDRLKQSHYVAQIDLVGNQDEQWCGCRTPIGGSTSSASTRRCKSSTACRRGTSTSPAGRSSYRIRTSWCARPASTSSAAQIGSTVMDTSAAGYARSTCALNLVEVYPAGYQDPASTMNFRTIKVRKGDHADAAAESQDEEEKVPETYDLQTGRAITISVRQVKGTNIGDYDRDMNAAITDLKQLLPPDASASSARVMSRRRSAIRFRASIATCLRQSSSSCWCRWCSWNGAARCWSRSAFP